MKSIGQGLARILCALVLLVSATVVSAQNVTTVAGGYVGDGGLATKAALVFPNHAVQDKNGNTYISELYGQRIRKVSASGGITTYAGTGIAGYSGDGGKANAAKIFDPTGMVFDSAGDLVFAEQGNSVVRKVTPAGIISTIAGTGVYGYSGDGGPATQAMLGSPWAVAYDSKGNLYISDITNEVVRRVDTSGIITTYAGNGTLGYTGDGGLATQATMDGPSGLALDGNNNLYIADRFNHVVRQVNAATGIITTFAGNGTQGFSGDGGPATQAAMGNVRGLAFSRGSLYISNAGSSRVRYVVLSTGIINTYAGTIYGYDGEGHALAAVEFARPTGIVLNNTVGFMLTDTDNARVRKLTNGVLKTFAGGYTGDGKAATSAALNQPLAIVFDKFGNYYIADAPGNTVRKVNAAGVITTIAGTGVSGYSGDGGPATSAELYYPDGVGIDSAGNIYISDNSNFVIRKVDSAGNISTFATNPNFFSLGAMAVDSANNLYVVDQSTCVLWKITPAAAVSVVAGVEFVCGYNGDNISATTADLNLPYGVALDTRGDIYIADAGNNRIRKVNALGIISTLAGDGNCGFVDNVPPTSGEMCSPAGVTVTPNGGAIYIADEFNLRVRKVASNLITTYAGTGLSGFNGDGPALTTNFDDPFAVAFDSKGNLYMVDDAVDRVRKIH
jgi:sugar lactone lactonase YvrE